MPDIPSRLRLRRGTAAQWASVNPTLAAGEPGFETDTGLLRIGNGVDAFDELPALLTSETLGDALGFDPAGFVALREAAPYTGNLNAALEGFALLGAGASNAPAGFSLNNAYVLTLRVDTNNAVQLAFDGATRGMARRNQVDGTWGAWSGAVMADGDQTINGVKTFAGTVAAANLRPVNLLEPTGGGAVAIQTGFTAANDADGSFSAGTYTPTPVGGNFKSITNGGAFTIAAPVVAGLYTMVLEVTNGAGAGAITMSGFSRVAGDVFTTTNGHRFQIFIAKTQNGTTATVVAMQ